MCFINTLNDSLQIIIVLGIDTEPEFIGTVDVRDIFDVLCFVAEIDVDRHE